MIGYLLAGLVGLVVLLLVAHAFVNANPAKLATVLRTALAVILLLIAIGLCFTWRFELALPLFAFAIALFRRRPIAGFGAAGSSSGAAGGAEASKGASQQRSNVRSAYFDMELDHATGSVSGRILTGAYAGRALDSLDEKTLITLYHQLSDDPDSASLLEVYLDSRFATWRENIERDAHAGGVGAAHSGAMSEQEAYQILGLSAGASARDIRAAHRRLMKRVHPDMGGSAFLAAKLNQAKDVLIHRHSNPN